MIPVSYQEIHVRKSPLYFLTAILLVFLFIVNDTDNTDAKTWIAIGILLLAALFYYVLNKKNIIIDNDAIRQQLLFGKERALNWGEIKSANLEWHANGHGASLTWYILSITGKRISFEPTFYSRRSLRAIAEALTSKCPNATIDSRIKKMAEGKFPWYIF